MTLACVGCGVVPIVGGIVAGVILAAFLLGLVAVAFEWLVKR